MSHCPFLSLPLQVMYPFFSCYRWVLLHCRQNGLLPFIYRLTYRSIYRLTYRSIYRLTYRFIYRLTCWFILNMQGQLHLHKFGLFQGSVEI